jgi:glycosyltransferase involved in cell wall biosynthesis
MIVALQIIDTLRIGGAERMAVNIANGLADNNVESYICATREEGLLKQSIQNNVGYIFLNRKSILDIKAIIKLRKYIKHNKINTIHAHGTSFLIATIAKILRPNLKLVWHDHHGNRVKKTTVLKLGLLKMASLYFNMIFCVNNELKDWALKKLYCRNVNYIPNFPTIDSRKETVLKGNAGKRIICIANLRNPKNHILLFSVFNKLMKEYKGWSLHCIGNIYNDEYSNNLKIFIKDSKLENHIFLYGASNDISNIITQGDIGVLTSTSEGLPMALLEYGLGKLPIIATDVGHCDILIPNNTYGILALSNDKDALLSGFKSYFSDVDYRNKCAVNFHNKVVKEFSEANVIHTIVKQYAL